MARVQQPNICERAFNIPVFTDVLNMGIDAYGYIKNYHPNVNTAVSFAETKATTAWDLIAASEVAKKADEKYNIANLALRAGNVTLDFIETAVGNMKSDPSEEKHAENENVSDEMAKPQTPEEAEVNTGKCPFEKSEPIKKNAEYGAFLHGSCPMRPLAILLCAILFEVQRQILAIEIVKHYQKTLTEKSTQISNGAATLKGDLQTKSEVVRTELSAKREIVKENVKDVTAQVGARVEEAKLMAGEFSVQARSHVDSATVKASEYASTVVESAKSRLPRRFSGETSDEPVAPGDDEVISEPAKVEVESFSETPSRMELPTEA